MKLPVIIFIILLSFSSIAKSNESECPEELKSKLLAVKSDFFDLIKELIDESDYSNKNINKKLKAIISKHNSENSKLTVAYLSILASGDDDETLFFNYATELSSLENEYKDKIEKEPKIKNIFVELNENTDTLYPHLKLDKFRSDFFKVIYFLFTKKVYDKDVKLVLGKKDYVSCESGSRAPGFGIVKKKSVIRINVGY